MKGHSVAMLTKIDLDKSISMVKASHCLKFDSSVYFACIRNHYYFCKYVEIRDF